jgi:hypothetical protein
MNRTVFKLFVTLIFAVIGIGIIALDITFMPLRLLFVLPLIFVLPGYALTRLVMPAALSTAERLALSLGLSIGLAVLGGLFLHTVGLGLQSDAWVSFLGSITLVTAVGALHRAYRHSLTAEPTVAWSDVPLRTVALLALAILLSGSAFQVARWGATHYGQSHFTQLWLTHLAATATEQTLQFGIRSEEATTLHYRLELQINGMVAQVWDDLTLAPGQSWETTVALPVQQMGAGELSAHLYRADQPGQAYRYVVWKTK